MCEKEKEEKEKRRRNRIVEKNIDWREKGKIKGKCVRRKRKRR